LARRVGRGRTLGLTAIADPAATPTQVLTAVLPATPLQVGILSAVTWSYPDDLMTLTARGLGDITPGSIAALVGSIDPLVGTIDGL
jgi:hypothetical protein